MGKIKRAFTAFIMAGITFLSTIVFPLMLVEKLSNGISISGYDVRVEFLVLNVDLLILLGLIVTILTLFNYFENKYVSGFSILLKYLGLAYYEWTWFVGVRKLKLTLMSSADIITTFVGIHLGLWAILVIAVNIIRGISKCLVKLGEEKTSK